MNICVGKTGYSPSSEEELKGLGKVRGHLVSVERELIYRGLIREGVIQVV